MPSLRELGEFEVLRRLAAAREAPAGTIVDSGDDAAVLRTDPDRELVVTTDAFVEGRHYPTGRLAAAAIGERLALANLSDLAAMAAEPRWALLSMGVRSEHDADELVLLQAGVARALSSEGAGLVGGNLTAVEGAEWFSLTLLGEVERGRAWSRGGARPGDLMGVTGSPGRAAAGLRLLRAADDARALADLKPVIDAWRSPACRVRAARTLAASGVVTAAIDISDGFAGDLARLCAASGVGAEVDAAAWPDDPALDRAAVVLGVTVGALRFGPGDDYELLLAVDPSVDTASLRSAGVTLIGRFTGAPSELTQREPGGNVRTLPRGGFDHFAAEV